MSLPTSAYLSRGKYTIAIAGGTGKIGSLISNVFLSSSYRPFYSEIRLLVRDTDSPKAQELAQLGATLVQVDILDKHALNEALRGVDAVINALGAFNNEAKTKLLDEVLASNAVLYIPSEYGVDHRLNDFEHILWTGKRQHISRARTESGGRLKVVAIYVGFFLETGFNPVCKCIFFRDGIQKNKDCICELDGVDNVNKRFNIIGSKDTKTTYTAMEDIARSVAQITTMALSSPSSIPDDVRVAGTTVSWEDMRRVMSKESGEDIEIVSLDKTESFRKETIEKEGTTGKAAEYIRLLMSEGKIDFSGDNQNELINPGERLWKWTTMEDYARKVKGRL